LQSRRKTLNVNNRQLNDIEKPRDEVDHKKINYFIPRKIIVHRYSFNGRFCFKMNIKEQKIKCAGCTDNEWKHWTFEDESNIIAMYKRRKNLEPIYPTRIVKLDHFKTEGHKKEIKQSWQKEYSKTTTN